MTGLLRNLIVLVALPAVPVVGHSREPSYAPAEVIVKLAPHAQLPEVQVMLESNGCVIEEIVGSLDLLLVSCTDHPSALQRSAAIASHPDIAFAHPNYVGGGGFVPNDTHFSSQWHHDNRGGMSGTPGADIESIPAWDITRGEASVVVAILDTGIDSDHPEFAGRILPGFDFVNSDSNPEDDHSHGTSVAGLLAANADNAFGVAGVDHFCSILPVKVLNAQNRGTTFHLIQALDFAAGVDVISMSLIGYPPTTALVVALQHARDAGSTLVACAGNGGLGDANISYPGASPFTISVGASDRRDVRALFSGTGNALDVLAPGVGVRTVRWNSGADSLGAFTGCSAATPIVAGIASLLLSANPTVSHRDIRKILTTTAEDQVGLLDEDTPGRDDYYGHGRVNLLRALSAALRLVEIDIKPDSEPNSINPSLEGELPVAVLASNSFSVEEVDLTTLAFGPSGAPFDHQNGPHFEDLNGDGLTDLLAHYRIEKSGIGFGDREACLRGDTLDGARFEGCDSVRTVPDMDGDGLLDLDEAALGTSALNPDSDGDGYRDDQEIRLMGTDPLDASDPAPVGERSRIATRRR